MTIKLLKKILNQPSQILLRGMESRFKQLGYTDIERNEFFLYAKGTKPVLLVAHVDTVHEPYVGKDRRILHDQKRDILWCPTGLGADDRAGVYGILEIVKNGHRPSILLTEEEEWGGVGAKEFLAHRGHVLQDYHFMIELDRKGREEAVYYSCENEEFKKYINSFGFKTSIGTFSDISVLLQSQVCAVNLSIGYRDEHMNHETLYIRHMYNTIGKVCDMLGKPTKEYRFTPYTWHSEYPYGLDAFTDTYPLDKNITEEYRNVWFEPSNGTFICPYCGGLDIDYESEQRLCYCNGCTLLYNVDDYDDISFTTPDQERLDGSKHTNYRTP